MQKLNANIEKAMWNLYFKVQQIKNNTKEALENKDGDAYIDTVVKILIAVVIGSILLYALIRIMGDDESGVVKGLTDKIKDMFDEAVDS